MEENAYDIEVHTEVKKLEFMAGGVRDNQRTSEEDEANYLSVLKIEAAGI